MNQRPLTLHRASPRDLVSWTKSSGLLLDLIDETDDDALDKEQAELDGHDDVVEDVSRNYLQLPLPQSTHRSAKHSSASSARENRDIHSRCNQTSDYNSG